MRNRIAIFEWTPKPLTAWLILAATGCLLTHAAVEIGGVWYAAGETRGTFPKQILNGSGVDPANTRLSEDNPC